MMTRSLEADTCGPRGGIAVYKYVMPCHDCGIYSKHLWTLYHDACETICLHSIVMLYLYIMYLYGLWPEIKSYYYIIIILLGLHYN